MVGPVQHVASAQAHAAAAESEGVCPLPAAPPPLHEQLGDVVVAWEARLRPARAAGVCLDSGRPVTQLLWARRARPGSLRRRAAGVAGWAVRPAEKFVLEPPCQLEGERVREGGGSRRAGRRGCKQARQDGGAGARFQSAQRYQGASLSLQCSGLVGRGGRLCAAQARNELVLAVCHEVRSALR